MSVSQCSTFSRVPLCILAFLSVASALICPTGEALLRVVFTNPHNIEPLTIKYDILRLGGYQDSGYVFPAGSRYAPNGTSVCLTPETYIFDIYPANSSYSTGVLPVGSVAQVWMNDVLVYDTENLIPKMMEFSSTVAPTTAPTPLDLCPPTKSLVRLSFDEAAVEELYLLQAAGVVIQLDLIRLAWESGYKQSIVLSQGVSSYADCLPWGTYVLDVFIVGSGESSVDVFPGTYSITLDGVTIRSGWSVLVPFMFDVVTPVAAPTPAPTVEVCLPDQEFVTFYILDASIIPSASWEVWVQTFEREPPFNLFATSNGTIEPFSTCADYGTYTFKLNVPDQAVTPFSRWFMIGVGQGEDVKYYGRDNLMGDSFHYMMVTVEIPAVYDETPTVYFESSCSADKAHIFALVLPFKSIPQYVSWLLVKVSYPNNQIILAGTGLLYLGICLEPGAYMLTVRDPARTAKYAVSNINTNSTSYGMVTQGTINHHFTVEEVVVTAAPTIYVPTAAPTSFESYSCSSSNDTCYLQVQVVPDQHYNQTSWTLVDLSQRGSVVSAASSSAATSISDAAERLSQSHCISSNSKYMLIVQDKGGDGICCDYGKGYLEIYANSKLLNRATFQQTRYSTMISCPVKVSAESVDNHYQKNFNSHGWQRTSANTYQSSYA